MSGTVGRNRLDVFAFTQRSSHGAHFTCHFPAHPCSSPTDARTKCIRNARARGVTRLNPQAGGERRKERVDSQRNSCCSSAVIRDPWSDSDVHGNISPHFHTICRAIERKRGLWHRYNYSTILQYMKESFISRSMSSDSRFFFIILNYPFTFFL